MITHVVLLKIAKNVSDEDVDRVFEELSSLRSKIPGIVSYSGGTYASDEGLNRGYTHAFTFVFTDDKARNEYLPHPEHMRVKGHLIEVVEGGLDGICAFDYVS